MAARNTTRYLQNWVNSIYNIKDLKYEKKLKSCYKKNKEKGYPQKGRLAKEIYPSTGSKNHRHGLQENI